MILKLDAPTTVSFCDSISHLSNDTNMYVVRIPLSGGRVPNLTIFDHYVYNTSNTKKLNLRKNTTSNFYIFSIKVCTDIGRRIGTLMRNMLLLENPQFLPNNYEIKLK